MGLQAAATALTSTAGSRHSKQGPFYTTLADGGSLLASIGESGLVHKHDGFSSSGFATGAGQGPGSSSVYSSRGGRGGPPSSLIGGDGPNSALSATESVMIMSMLAGSSVMTQDPIDGTLVYKKPYSTYLDIDISITIALITCYQEQGVGHGEWGLSL